MDGVTVINYSDNAEQVADASAGAVSATSTYLDMVAGWLMLLPEKMKGAVMSLRESSGDDIAVWVAALIALWLMMDVMVNRKRVIANVRMLLLTPEGLLIAGIIYVGAQGAKVVF